jgi:hypothetical protein
VGLGGKSTAINADLFGRQIFFFFSLKDHGFDHGIIINRIVPSRAGNRSQHVVGRSEIFVYSKIAFDQFLHILSRHLPQYFHPIEFQVLDELQTRDQQGAFN